MTSEFVFFSSNPSLNHIKIEKCLLLFGTNTDIFTLRFKETDGKSFICRLPFDVRPRNVKLNLAIIKSQTSRDCGDKANLAKFRLGQSLVQTL